MADTMSARVDDGGPAFPRDGFIGPNDYQEWPERGMSLRDYFAAHAPITLQDALELCAIPAWRNVTDAENVRVFAVLADMRLRYADAMLKAREPKS